MNSQSSKKDYVFIKALFFFLFIIALVCLFYFIIYKLYDEYVIIKNK